MKIERVTTAWGEVFIFCTFRKPGINHNIVSTLAWSPHKHAQTVYFHAEDPSNPGRPHDDAPADVISYMGWMRNDITLKGAAIENASASSDVPEYATLKAVGLCLHPWAGALIDKIHTREQMMDAGRAQSDKARELTQEVQDELAEVGLPFDAATMASLGARRYLRYAETGQ
jgi:hypothetical protein